MATGAASIGIEVTGAKALQRALKAIAETDAPYMREALEDGARLLEGAVESRAPGGIGRTVAFVGVKGTGAKLKATVVVKHPGAKSMEFGRQYYYRGFTNRRMKATGQKFKASPGQPKQPFVGIMNQDKAIGSVKGAVREKIERAIEREWERIGAGPD